MNEQPMVMGVRLPIQSPTSGDFDSEGQLMYFEFTFVVAWLVFFMAMISTIVSYVFKDDTIEGRVVILEGMVDMLNDQVIMFEEKIKVLEEEADRLRENISTTTD